MKKIISLIFGAAFIFALAGCKDPNQANKQGGSNNVADAQTS
jgi:uncharacterized lipoprotein YehR (DUF1307 family)